MCRPTNRPPHCQLMDDVDYYPDNYLCRLMHDGVVWELSLKPKNFSLPRTWMLQDKPDGDRIAECCLAGHTPEECEVFPAKAEIENCAVGNAFAHGVLRSGE